MIRGFAPVEMVDFLACLCYFLGINQPRYRMKNEILHLKFAEYGKNAKEWLRKCALLLPEIQKRRIWEQKGFSSIYEYAAKLAGMSRHQVKNALWIMKKIEDKPYLQEVAGEKGLNSVRPVITVATPETEKFWAEKAKQMPKNVLETYVRDMKKQKNKTASSSQKMNKSCPSTPFGFVEISMKLRPEILDKLNKLKGGGDFNALMEKFIRMYEENLEQEKPEAVKTKSRAIPAPIQKFVVRKTNGSCSFPGCGKSGTEKHHTDRYALKHGHDPDKIHLLCREHHRLMHYGLIENEGMRPEFWRVRRYEDRFDIRHMVDREVRAYGGG